MDKHYQVQLTSGLRDLFPATQLSLPATVGVDELNSIVRQLCSAGRTDLPECSFDFLVNKVLLRSTFGEHAVQYNLSDESVVEVECIESQPKAEPCFSVSHRDWVSSVRCTEDTIISGCFDGNLHFWNFDGSLVTKSNLNAAVHCIDFIPSQDDTDVVRMATALADRSMKIVQFDPSDDKVTVTHNGQGHEDMVQCVSCNEDGSRLASGSLDTFLKIWDANSSTDIAKDWKENKKTAKEGGSVIITPCTTLAGHRARVTTTSWLDETHVVSGSWDRTICLWNLSALDKESTLTSPASVNWLACSSLNNLILSASVDQHIRLWDFRSQEGSMVKASFSGHKKWVSSVDWCKTNPNLFVSASYDCLLKMWDLRSQRSSIYDFTGHKDRLLCCYYSETSRILSGGVDGRLNVFQSDQ